MGGEESAVAAACPGCTLRLRLTLQRSLYERAAAFVANHRPGRDLRWCHIPHRWRAVSCADSRCVPPGCVFRTPYPAVETPVGSHRTQSRQGCLETNDRG